MSREDRFTTADLDVGLFHDPKVIALARHNRDGSVTAQCMAMYVALVLQSWAAGERLTVDDAMPAWWLETPEACREALRSVRLIDDESRIPETSWDSWFMPAWERRESRRRDGRIFGLKSHGMSIEEAVKEASRRESSGSPKGSRSTPRGHLDPSVSSGRPPSLQAGPAGASATPTAIGAVLADAAATCAVCHDDLVGEPWKPRKENGGRMVNVHDRCYHVEGVA